MMRSADRIRQLADLARLAERGYLDELPCPRCAETSISVRFSNPRPGEYFTWFICFACGFYTRAQNCGLPRHFSPSRVDCRLEDFDRR